MVRQGGTVAGKEVFMIFRERVFFKENGNVCYIAMFQPPPPPPAPSASPSQPGPPPPPGGPDKVPDSITKGIQKIDDTHFNIDRLTKEQIIAHSTDFMKSTRIAPVSDPSGKTLGIQLNNIRPDTLMGMLGMQNGDLLQTINGFEMTSPEKALEAYAKLGSAPQIQVAVVRNGKPTTLEFNIK
jgi:general secretion pathway protein C